MRTGYGNFGIAKGIADGAHRYSYRIHNGEIPKGLFVCHRCNEKLCVNPKHLYVATCLQNTRDAQADNLLGRKLTAEKVKEIRRLHLEGFSHKKIKDRMGCAKSMVYYVLHRKAWAHIQ